VSEARFDGIDQRLERLEAGQTELRTSVDQRFDELRRHMGVLHEEALDRIAAVAEGFPRLEAKMDRKFAELTEAMGRRLDPLEAVVREHSASLRRHDIEIAALKRRRK